MEILIIVIKAEEHMHKSILYIIITGQNNILVEYNSSNLITLSHLQRYIN